MGETSFEIKQIDKNKHVLIEYDMDYCRNAYQMEPPEENPGDTLTLPPSTEDPDNIQITLLALYTDNAKQADINIFNTINSRVSHLNDILDQSVPDINVFVKLARVQQIDFTEEKNEMGYDIIRLRTNTDVQDLRMRYSADIVALFTNGDYETINGVQQYGIASMVESIFSHAFVIVEHDSPPSYYTLSHEIGHLFGAWDDGYPYDSYSHGYVWQVHNIFGSNDYTTVMRQPGGSIRYPGFSNPDVYYEVNPTGIWSDHGGTNYDVARKIESTYQSIADFYDGFDDLAVSISGTSNGNTYTSYTWTANVTGGFAPYGYHWAYSLDGVSYIDYTSQSESLTTTFPHDDTFFLRVFVLSSDVQFAHGFNTVYVDQHQPFASSNGHGLIMEKNSLEKDNTSLINLDYSSECNLQVFPNPINEASMVKFTIPLDSHVRLMLKDINGKTIKTIKNCNYSMGIYNESIDFKFLKKGIYFLTLDTDYGSMTKKMLIQ